MANEQIPLASGQLAVKADPDVAARSFEEFFAAEKGPLFGALYIVTRSRSEAEEYTQEAFVRVLEHWDRVSRVADPAGYLYRTALNLDRKAYRRAALWAKRGVGLIPDEDPIEEVDAMDAAMRALAPLSRQQRAAVVLIDLLGYSSADAGKVLGIRASTVRMHASRAHAALRAAIGGTR